MLSKNLQKAAFFIGAQVRLNAAVQARRGSGRPPGALWRLRQDPRARRPRQPQNGGTPRAPSRAGVTTLPRAARPWLQFPTSGARALEAAPGRWAGCGSGDPRRFAGNAPRGVEKGSRRKAALPSPGAAPRQRPGREGREAFRPAEAQASPARGRAEAPGPETPRPAGRRGPS